MGREARKVRPDWVHPFDEDWGHEKPLHDGFTLEGSTESWDEESAKWERGEFPEYADEENRCLAYSEWAGDRPDPADYMPVWTDEEATHYQMYETTTEGTPMSPVFAGPEELATWLASSGASTFGPHTTDREGWMRIILGADAFLQWSSASGAEIVIS